MVRIPMRIGVVHLNVVGSNPSRRGEFVAAISLRSSCADHDVWFRLSTRSTGEVLCMELIYVDNFLVISKQAESVLRKEIGSSFF